METYLLLGFFVLGIVTIVHASLLLLQTWEHRRYALSRMAQIDRRRELQGRALIFAPCKGTDVELEENLTALMRQDYHDYEVVFIVESDNDPACQTIHRVMTLNPRVPSRLVVAGRSTQTGQKIHNLRMATADLSPDVCYLAFVDSDAGPRPQWLRTMVARLNQATHGAVTGYRWLVPQRNSLANLLINSINGGLMSLMGPSSHYLLWGGSWGIRRAVFDEIGLHKAWEHTLSDDLMASRTLRQSGLRVCFEPACVVASPTDYTAQDMFTFLRRQYLVGRFYTPDWWWFAIAGTSFTGLLWLLNFAALIFAAVSSAVTIWIPATTLAVTYGLSIARGYLRGSLVRTYFPELQKTLRVSQYFDVFANPLVALVTWAGVFSSGFGQTIAWRGVKYFMLPGGKIDRVERQDILQEPADTDQARPATLRPSEHSTQHRKAG